MMMMFDLATRIATTGQLLVRSGIEIDHVLSDMVQQHSTVSASLPSQNMFLSRLVSSDPVRQRVTFACSDYKSANTTVLAQPSVIFRCNHRWGQFAFGCTKPRMVDHAGEQVIEMTAPTAILALQHRRRPVRPPAMTEPAELYCKLPMAPIAFEARIVDMSLDGRAFLVADPGIPLCAGTRLQDVRITPRGREPLRADIEVTHVIPSMQAGHPATRVACRIIAPEATLEQLVRTFIIEFT
jgi:c-di-GMP-binding flagellar brake protein YcgR